MKYLAAIRFDDGQDIDDVLRDFVWEQQARGFDVKGVLQARGQSGGECFCADMDLHAIGCEEVFPISQPLGNGSSGCRLDPGALAECSAFLVRQIEHGADLLVLNRFGKGESEGRGFRDLISSAFANHIPVLTAVRPAYFDAWQQFSGDFGLMLSPDSSAIEGWFNALERSHAA